MTNFETILLHAYLFSVRTLPHIVRPTPVMSPGSKPGAIDPQRVWVPG